MLNSFKDLGLSKKTLSAVDELGYDTPTPVQEQAIPLILKGHDIIAGAKTGTGKTAAFALPVMAQLDHVQRGQGPLFLIITPTRELAQQIGAVCETIAHSTHHRIATVVGGVSYLPQRKQLKQGVDILIATPGRLIDLMEQKAVKLNNVKALVLDEADRMLDMGFWPTVKKIAAETPTVKQTLFFSATIDQTVLKTAQILLKEPVQVSIASRGETADTVEQFVMRTSQLAKIDLLRAILAERGAHRVIVFARTRSRADSTARKLKRAGFLADAIHSDRSQSQRERALESFARGKTNILVATDVLSRGIDISEVDYVVNLDLPNQPEDYIHRIGRTGRAGEKGYSISLVCPEQEAWLRDIEKLIKKEIPKLVLNNYNPTRTEEETATQAAAQAAAQAATFKAKQDPETAAAVDKYLKKDLAPKKKRPDLRRTKKKDPSQSSSKAHKPSNPAGQDRQTDQSNPAGQSSPASQSKATSQSRSGPSKKKSPRRSLEQTKDQGNRTNERHQSGAASNMRPGRAQRAEAAAKRRNR